MNTPDIDELNALFGPGGVVDYHDTYDSAKPQLITWARELSSLNDDELYSEAVAAAYDAALANNQALWRHESHARNSACIHQARLRWKAAGHAEDCEGENLHGQALKEAAILHDHNFGKPDPCTCAVREPLRGRWANA